MLNDISTASAAGCRTALFAGDRRSLRLREGENTVEPDMIITGLTELESLIT
jgi:putative hydrolase of the HAD superfamily